MKYFASGILASLLLSVPARSAGSDELSRAKSKVAFVYARLTGGLKPSPNELNTWAAQVVAATDKRAALLSIADEAVKMDSFYSVTVLDFAQLESNKDRALLDEAGTLSDLTATVVGLTRDEKDYRTILYDDIIYVPARAAYDAGSNTIYDILNTSVKNGTAQLSTSLKASTQTETTGLSVQAGIFTLRGFGSKYYEAGTNRGPVRFTFINYVCRDMEDLSDITVDTNSIRRDVDRKPGNDPAKFVNECRGCHFALDPMAGAFAFYDYIPPLKVTDAAPLLIATTPNAKTNRNNAVFPGGMTVKDDSWENNWLNSDIYKDLWEPSKAKGKGVKEFGEMIAATKMFPECMAKRAFKTICLGDGVKAIDKASIEKLSSDFVKGSYNMKALFKNAAVECGSRIGQ
ncbi:MAG: hypothetical protein H7249_12445 [Chitinophagaceae bacterium]|nr:hypothetical protein [Oligoflexus sp.]